MPPRLDHQSFAVSGPLALLGNTFYAVLVHLLAIYAPRFLPTISHPHAVALRFVRRDQLTAGLAPTGVRSCWAHQKKEPLTPQQPAAWPIDGTSHRIYNHANVFSLTSLDTGARFFLQYLPQDIEGTLVDLGCGNCILGLMALSSNPRATIQFVDES